MLKETIPRKKQQYKELSSNLFIHRQLRNIQNYYKISATLPAMGRESKLLALLSVCLEL